MKASFTATQPLTTIKRFVAVYSDDRSRKRDRVELRQCGFRAGTATALFQSAESKDVTKPVAVWTSVVRCTTAAQARRFAVEERQDVNREWTKKPTAAIVRRQPAKALPHGALAAVAATKLTGGGKASLTIVLVPRGPNVAVLTLTSQTGFNPYPQARNLMRRMLGLKPIAVAKKTVDAAAARRAGRDRALRAGASAAAPPRAHPRRSADLLLRGLLGGLERVQHLLLDVGRSLGERHHGLAAVRLDAAGAVMARLGGRGQRERAMSVGADVDGDRLGRCNRSFHDAKGTRRQRMASPMRSQSSRGLALLTM